MAKNFTDFQQVTGAYTAPTTNDGSITGDTVTDATSSMYLVGYDTDAPDGERQYTIESVLLAADKYHVGLENVDNTSDQHVLNDTTLTGHTSADNMFIHGDLIVEGDTTQLNTHSIATSSFDISNYGTDVGLEVKQFGTTHAVARFYNGDDLTLDVTSSGTVGVGVMGDMDTLLTVAGDISATGEVLTTGAINGRYIQQDGAKLDNIQPWADVTSSVLGDLFAHMTMLKNTSVELSQITPIKAFDLIEQGDIYTKIPEMSAVGGDGVGDFSVTKIKTLEYDADVTGAHSADITYNDVPDGPWTGFIDNTFVKVTSGQHIRLTSIRGVETNLFSGDDGADISSTHVRDAYQSAYPDHWSTADELEYRGTIIPDLQDTRTNVSSTSAARDATISRVSGSGDLWDSTHTSVNDTSGNWDSTHTSVSDTSATWDSTHTSVSDTSATWDSTHTSVNGASGNWDSTHTSVNGASGNWDESHTTLQAYSGVWDTCVHNTLDEFGNHRELAPGTTELHTCVTEGLTATHEAKFSNEVCVLSAGEWKEGITVTVPLGEDRLVFVNGILVDWQQ